MPPVLSIAVTRKVRYNKREVCRTGTEPRTEPAKSEIELMSGIMQFLLSIKDLGLILFGFFLAILYEYWQRRGKLKTHWAILSVEVGLCERRARNYLSEGSVVAPLYRLPTTAFSNSFPVLVSEANLSSEDFCALSEFYSWSDDINRGLDNAHELRKSGNNDLEEESRRLESKCRKLLEDYLDPVIETLKRHGVSLSRPTQT